MTAQIPKKIKILPMKIPVWNIYKFDGIDYYAYKKDLEDNTSLSSNIVQCAFIDSKKRLWFGTENGLNLYDKDLDQFKRISLKSKFKENILDRPNFNEIIKELNSISNSI